MKGEHAAQTAGPDPRERFLVIAPSYVAARDALRGLSPLDWAYVSRPGTLRGHAPGTRVLVIERDGMVPSAGRLALFDELNAAVAAGRYRLIDLDEVRPAGEVP